MIDRVTAYAQEVVAGRIVCGSLHRCACQRHLHDLSCQRTEAFPYYWDPEAAERVLQYAETLTIAEGAEPKPVKLIPSQIFDIGCTFGWKKVSNDCRRFRRRYKSMARQNGKTFENGILGTYIAGFSGYQYGKLFTVATKQRQARLAWEEMSKFINADPDLREKFDPKDYKSTIVALDTGCTIEALSREAGLDDGFRPIFCSVDEIHQHKDNKVYKAMYNGTRSLPETLVSMITTRGDQLQSFCKEMDDYHQADSCDELLSSLQPGESLIVEVDGVRYSDVIAKQNAFGADNCYFGDPNLEEYPFVINYMEFAGGVPWYFCKVTSDFGEGEKTFEITRPEIVTHLIPLELLDVPVDDIEDKIAEAQKTADSAKSAFQQEKEYSFSSSGTVGEAPTIQIYPSGTVYKVSDFAVPLSFLKNISAGITGGTEYRLVNEWDNCCSIGRSGYYIGNDEYAPPDWLIVYSAGEFSLAGETRTAPSSGLYARRDEKQYLNVTVTQACKDLLASGALPPATASDAGKFLRVNVDGAWEAQTVPSAEEASF